MNLSDLRKLCGEATPGPWFQDDESDFILAASKGNNPVVELRGHGAGFDIDANAAFIAAARTYLPRLIEDKGLAIRALRHLLECGYVDKEAEPFVREALAALEAE